MPRHYWSCRKCNYRNERTSSRKCGYCGDLTKPKKHVPVHARTLRDDSFAVYLQANHDIHGVDRECAVCGREPRDDRNMDRDHGHDRSELSYGKPRGLACPGDWGCNKVMSRLTLVRARQIVAYLERVEAFYSQEASRV